MAVSRKGQGSSVNTKSSKLKAKRTVLQKVSTSNGGNISVENKTKDDSFGAKHQLKRFWTRLYDNWALCSVLLLTLATVICYWNTFSGSLVHDDVFAIQENPDIHPSTPILDLFKHDYWGQPLDSPISHKSYRPLSVLTFRLHYLLHGLNPFGYRLINVLLHLATTLLFVGVCKKVLACSLGFSVLSGLLFAVHPIHSEAVNAVVGRADILACFFFLLAFLSYSKCIRHSSKKLTDQNSNKISLFTKCVKPCWKSLILFNMLAAAALFAKENGITVFGFCIMYDIMVAHECHLDRLTKQVSRRIYNSLLVRIIIVTSVSSILLYFRLSLQNGQLPQFTPDENPAAYSNSSLTKVLTYSYLCAFNAWLLLVPYTLCYDWQMASIPLVESLSDVRNCATILFFVGLLVLFVLASAAMIFNDPGERKILLTGLLLLTIPFLPATNILFTVGFVVAERILYIPSLGYCLLINFAFAKCAGLAICGKDKPNNGNTVTTTQCETSSPYTQRFKITALVYLAMLICFSYKTWQQSAIWQNRGTLFKSGVDTLPQNAKAHFNYANHLRDVQKKVEAIHHYQTAIKLSPDHASAHNNLGLLLYDKQDSIKHFQLAIQSNPYHANAFLNLGILYSSLGEFNESESYLKESLRLNPNSTKTLMVLTDVMSRNGHFEEACQLFTDRILATKESDVTLLNSYGLLLTKNGQFNDALQYFNKAHTLAPDHSVPVINKANVFVAMGKSKDAENTLKKFLKKRQDASVYHHLASFYYNILKQPLDAEINWKEALKINALLSDALLGYLELLKSQKRNDEALAIINYIWKYYLHKMEVLQEMANLLHNMGFLEKAADIVDSMLEISVEPAMYFLKGNILKDMKLYEEAILAYNKALNVDANLPEVYANLGAAHHVLGNLSAAEISYKHCLALDPDNVAAKTNLERIRDDS